MIDLLVVGLQDELAKGAAAVSVNLEDAKQTKKNTLHTTTIISFLNDMQFSEAPSFHTQGLMSPYLRASITNFRQSPMS